METNRIGWKEILASMESPLLGVTLRRCHCLEFLEFLERGGNFPWELFRIAHSAVNSASLASEMQLGHISLRSRPFGVQLA